MPVHPHACGDNHSEQSCNKLKVRFTPTRVGTICLALFLSSALTVHPHACGDNMLGLV